MGARVIGANDASESIGAKVADGSRAASRAETRVLRVAVNSSRRVGVALGTIAIAVRHLNPNSLMNALDWRLVEGRNPNRLRRATIATRVEVRAGFVQRDSCEQSCLQRRRAHGLELLVC